jgi:dTDP-glucose pyrophosphorylase
VSIPSTNFALVVLAAGAGRRYQGLKQLAPVGPHGESIMEFSIYDALAAGFDQVVLVIRREHETMFREKFVDQISDRVALEFAYQESSVAPWTHAALPHRERRWGTAHAVLCARRQVHTPFAVINADDFYGRSAVVKMAAYLRNTIAANPRCGALVGYRLRHTLSDFGPVSRGLCELDENAFLVNIIECHAINPSGHGGMFFDDQGRQHWLGGDELVSMNLWGFHPTLFERWEQNFQEFVARVPSNDSEFEIPGNVQRMIAAGELRIRVLESSEPWFGLTYPEDYLAAKSRIAALVDHGVYPAFLWEQP